MKVLMSFILTLFVATPTFADSNVEVSPKGNRYYSYNFGAVNVHWHQWVDFALRNNGVQPEQLRGVFITGGAYIAYTSCPNLIFPGQTCWTRVEFRPWFEGYHYGRLRFAFINDSIYIDLHGWGVLR